MFFGSDLSATVRVVLGSFGGAKVAAVRVVLGVSVGAMVATGCYVGALGLLLVPWLPLSGAFLVV